jgi:hypothetical protein
MSAIKFELDLRWSGIGLTADEAVGDVRQELEDAGEQPSDREIIASLNDSTFRDGWMSRLKERRPDVFVNVPRTRSMTDTDFAIETCKAATRLTDDRWSAQHVARLYSTGALGKTRREAEKNRRADKGPRS